MNMSKRDIGDIALVWMGLSLLMSLLTSIVTLGALLGMTDTAQQYTNKNISILFQVIHILVLLFLNYVLLFKRSLILTRVFPDGKEKEVSVPSGFTALTSYAFWIRLLGIFTFLSSTIRFLGQLATEVGFNQHLVFPQVWMFRSGAEFISAILSLAVIWKADWIADKIGKMGSSSKA